MNHEKYIKRCLQLAKNGIGTARPNPSVGAVIVYENKIIGEGYTSVYGGNHAEVNAINAVKNKALLHKSTIYVTLEPCAHFGKTPPCADLIIKNKIPNVIVGCLDTNSLVAGKGIERLKNAGVNVVEGILEKECKTHHKRFFTVQNKKRPYVILKWAQTSDNFIAPLTKKEKSPVWISNIYSQQLVHKLRSKEQAILVGTNTVIADNPSLTVRNWSGENPIRVILDKSLRISKNATVFDGNVKTIVLTSKVEKIIRQKEQSEKNIFFEQIDFTSNIVVQICNVLQKHQIQSVIIEGGTQTLQSFINANIWDEAMIFVGEKTFKKGVEAPKINGQLIKKEYIENDVLKKYIND
ncbi:bifunctional diaminohydroxyphosphoribosylaminopyrimidine deaminase/5-amino-6-(5-phosphoribosylamino)uracil reductase RibD [Tenacibaculum aestuariivivum]|uniref:bifunctional diaminohydroxyphosphoribosylaminopyrimidine deaminase/5-amino-6-(5-phosphoribosylamino)uracil reductase RibD n=1 Tax=Tenacibaculum aestuariivivum TaxID=2006131 RepID=UPI003AB3C975